MSADILSAIYDATILLAIGLTTVLGAIFAIATTFLGRSLEDAREAQEKAENIASAESKAAVDEINDILAEARHTGDSQDTIDTLRSQLKKRGKAERARRWKQRLRPLIQGPSTLVVWGSVAMPGGFLVAAALGTAAAKALIADHFLISLEVWAGSLISLSFGIFLLLLTLKEVERVSKPSVQASFQGQVDALKQAFAEREEETQPIFSLECEESLPLRMTAGEERAINFRVNIQRKAVHNVELMLFVPPGFDILNSRRTVSGEGRLRLYPGRAREAIYASPSIAASYGVSVSARMRAPEKPGSYNFGYIFSSDELTLDTYNKPDDKIPVVVAEASPDSAELTAAK